MIILGVDLSGPSNSKDTAAAWFDATGEGLRLREADVGFTDRGLFRLVSGLSSEKDLAIGLDAPLSYNDGGGDRPRDKDLRKRIQEAGMHSGSVMTPTMMRMAYLTLRGISVARMLESLPARRLRIVEVHPFAALALHGAPVEQLREVKKDPDARAGILDWLETQGLSGVRGLDTDSDHRVAACACAFAAWRWHQGTSAWIAEADPPRHPYDFAC